MTESKTRTVETIYYSERGLVYLFTPLFFTREKYQDLKKMEEDLKKFIDCIKFLEAETRARIKKAIKSVKWIKVAIEPSLGQFGDPDILILFSTGSKYHCIFIEAKRYPLAKALRVKSGSNIVKQLINKMKLADSKVITNSKGEAKEIRYGTPKPHLKNPASIEILDEIISRARDNDVSLSRTVFYFISLTNEPMTTMSVSEENLKALADKIQATGGDALLRHIKQIGCVTFNKLREVYISSKPDIQAYNRLQKYLLKLT